jgi:hypothetical protein
MLARHQQKPVPFFGTVLADAIDVAVLAAGWGGAGSRGEDAGESGGGEGEGGSVLVGMAGTAPAMTIKASAAVTMATGPDDAMASGGRAGAGGLTDGPAATGMAGTSPAMTVNSGPPHPRQNADASLGVVTRLDQGPGWTLDVVRPRVGDGVAVSAAPEPVA